MTLLCLFAGTPSTPGVSPAAAPLRWSGRFRLAHRKGDRRLGGFGTEHLQCRRGDRERSGGAVWWRHSRPGAFPGQETASHGVGTVVVWAQSGFARRHGRGNFETRQRESKPALAIASAKPSPSAPRAAGRRQHQQKPRADGSERELHPSALSPERGGSPRSGGCSGEASPRCCQRADVILPSVDLWAGVTVTCIPLHCHPQRHRKADSRGFTSGGHIPLSCWSLGVVVGGCRCLG